LFSLKQAPLLKDANYDFENNNLTRERFESISFKIVWFFHKLCITLFHMLETFYLSSLFSKYYFNKLCFQLPQNVTWTDEITRMISTTTAINGVRLAHHISFASAVTYLFYCIFRNSACLGTFRESFKKIIQQLSFLRNHLKCQIPNVHQVLNSWKSHTPPNKCWIQIHLHLLAG